MTQFAFRFVDACGVSLLTSRTAKLKNEEIFLPPENIKIVLKTAYTLKY